MRRAAPSCQRKLERGICKRSERAGLSNQEPSGLWDGKGIKEVAWRERKRRADRKGSWVCVIGFREGP